jgi:hypothetical protein
MSIQKVDYLALNLDQNERTDFEFQRRRHAQWKENYELYRDFVITNRITQRQAVNIPLMKGTIKTILANTDEFPNIHFEEKGNNKDKEIFFNEYWAETVIRDKMELKDIIDKKQVYLYGKSWRKLNIGYGRFESEVLEPYDILVDRFADPSDLETANHLEHINIFRTLGQLASNPMYDQSAVNRLKTFYATKAGLVKADQVTQQQYRKNERLQDMGVVDINNPIVTETLLELKAHYVKVYDLKDDCDHLHLIIKADQVILLAKPMLDLLNVDFYPFTTWSDDPERNDQYPDGIADIVRTPNKLLNVWFSQMSENRTLRGFGMNYFNNENEAFQPQTYDPQPWGWYGVPGNPNDFIKRVDIPELGDITEEMDWIKGFTESATAATAATKGDNEKASITLGEVELTTQAAKERITSISKFYGLSQKEFGGKFEAIVNANPDKLDAVKIFKKGYRGNIFKKTITPKHWQSEDGYSVTVETTSERDTKNLDSIQKLNAVAAQFPGNIPMKKIYDKKLLDFAGLNPDEAKQVMDFEEQSQKNPQQPPGAPGQPPQAGLPRPGLPQLTPPANVNAVAQQAA